MCDYWTPFVDYKITLKHNIPLRIRKGYKISSKKEWNKFSPFTKKWTLSTELRWIHFFSVGLVTVKVKDGQDTATNFKGVLLQARKGSSPDTATYYGTWDVLSSNLRILNCGAGTDVSLKISLNVYMYLHCVTNIYLLINKYYIILICDMV